jgi:phosphoglycerol transferase MdoB-like AlkP superfamily enzyme
MKGRLKLFFSYMFYWVLVFILYKALFLIYHFDKTSALSISDLAGIFLHGLRMDVAMAGYFMLLVGLIIAATLKNKNSLKNSLTILTLILLTVTSLLAVIDMELYRIWGFRLDATPILYVTTNAAGATALGNNWVVVRQIIIWIGVIALSWWFFHKFITPQIEKLDKEKWHWAPVLILLTTSMILPIRGSLGMTPMNSSFVYFHKTNLYANHASLNLLWNASKSLTRLNELSTPNDFYDQEKTAIIWNKLYDPNTGPTTRLLNTDRPNVILLVLENFTSKFVESLGGKKGVTPTLERLIHDGVLFNHFYANGDRTERGILSVLSAYPPHPTSSITKFPNKTQNMGYISKELNKNGYSSGYICGYDLAYANFRSYFSNAGFDKITSEADFDSSIPRTKWGVDDHYVFNKWIEDINEMKPPFFMMHHTLSSHHPFVVPMETVIEGDDEESRFMNSAYYTDKSLGEFIEKAKQMDWWDNTLIIITADHGNALPDNVFNTVEEIFKIPMIWYGGALSKSDTVINTYGSQNDIAQTLLGQLGLKTDRLKFSRDLLAEESKSFAFYTFNNGFGFVTDSCALVYDNVSGEYMAKQGKCSNKLMQQGKVCMQMVYNDLSSL